ncbi:hypothetical protein SAMN02799624_05415 [Paenibacillus sp. UNC496MF]|uniref:hypothetical protein n=1 Tax=Paenibacillus sp. UNC496MF TaxID=1502753 RepID=UPI0008E0545F|nr:hypothetical protein [Paenibacillus sp. UNC496MF]SFJ65759.1 hypothetical protein SAMN02799624_05415 [Paenibacillus sp. UNC496MF]
MANLKNNSQLLYQQAVAQFDKAKTAFENGSIKTDTSLIKSVFQSFQDFFVSMGQPLMQLRLAPIDGPPWSDDYNNMMDELQSDLQIMFQEADILSKALYADFNYNQVQHSILDNQFTQIADKLKDLELLTTNAASNGRITFHRNDFVNQDKIDFDRIVGSPAHIENGAVTLQQKSATNVAEDAQVAIVIGNKTYDQFIIGSDSNGFPGNTHEVTVSPGSSLTEADYTYAFVGQKNSHANYGAVLDGNANTWFEYELVNIRDIDKQKVAKNLGFDYQVSGNQTLSWAKDPADGVLRLHMQVVLPEAKQINKVNVNLYTPPNYGAKPAIIRDVLISDGQNAPKSVLSASKKDEDTTFIFTPQNAKVISILFEQPAKYYTDIGHIYYEQKMQVEDGTAYVFDSLTKKTDAAEQPRINGPVIGLQDLGVNVKISDASVDANYPLRGSDQDQIAMDDVIYNLTRTINNENIDVGVERFEGWRYCIGVRDIEIWSCEYEQSAEIVSEPYYFDKPLEKITLSVDEDIPAPFYADDPSQKYKWIKYFVSIDDGSTWHPITPLERQPFVSGGEPAPPKIYTVQQVSKSSQATASDGYLESEYPVYSLRIRILFQRPEEESA